MSEWRFISEKRIQHNSGYELILNSGSWRDPHDIRPHVPKELIFKPLEIVRHLREGLLFACDNHIVDRA
mgnify:CR=1 FL=1